MSDNRSSDSIEAAWIAQAKRVLDESTRDLDAHTASRLNRARQTALALRAQREPRSLLLPAGLAGACAALLLAIAIWQPHHSTPRSVVTPNSSSSAAKSAGADSAAADADAAPAEDTLEFYQNLEFYAWLDAQGKDGNG